MSDKEAVGSAGRMILDVVVYAFARIALVAGLTAAIYFVARLIGIHEFPFVVAMLFAIVIALPAGIWLFGPLRKRVTVSIAAVDDRRRRDRERLQARLRGESTSKD